MRAFPVAIVETCPPNLVPGSDGLQSLGWSTAGNLRARGALTVSSEYQTPWNDVGKGRGTRDDLKPGAANR